MSTAGMGCRQKRLSIACHSRGIARAAEESVCKEGWPQRLPPPEAAIGYTTSEHDCIVAYWSTVGRLLVDSWSMVG